MQRPHHHQPPRHDIHHNDACQKATTQAFIHSSLNSTLHRLTVSPRLALISIIAEAEAESAAVPSTTRVSHGFYKYRFYARPTRPTARSPANGAVALRESSHDLFQSFGEWWHGGRGIVIVIVAATVGSSASEFVSSRYDSAFCFYERQ